MATESYRRPESSEPSSSIDFRELFRVFLERWWLLFPLAIVGGAWGYSYINHCPPAYIAKAVLQVQQEDPKLFGIEDFTRQDLSASEMLNTIVANIKNTAVLRRVVRTNNLVNDPVFLQNPGSVVSEEDAMRALALMVSCQLRKDTRLIDIKVTHASPAIGQKLANSVAQEYIRQLLDQRFSTANVINDLLSEEAAKLQRKLEASETALQAYKQEKKAVSLEERQNIVTDKLKDFNKGYTEAKTARLRIEADLEEIKKASNRVDMLLALPGVLLDTTVADLRQKVTSLEALVQALSLRYKAKHPRMAQAQGELKDLHDVLYKTVLAYPRSVQSAYDGAYARERQMENALRQAEQESLDLSQDAIKYNSLLREVQSDRQLYDSVLKRLKETDVTKGLEKQGIAIVEPATLPLFPSGPSKILVALLAAAAGFFGSLGLLYLLRISGKTIRAVDEAEETLGLPVVAAIQKAAKRGRKPRLVLTAEPDSPCAEAFRSLRTATHLVQNRESKRIILFTSAVPHEGKTFCSVNFALSLAMEGQRTLLLDMDLRRPSVAESFSVKAEAPGLGEYLLGEGRLVELTQPTEYPNLFLLPAGTPVSPEAMTESSLQKLLNEASEHFDRIVIDSAPINAVSDTFLLLPASHFIFMVVRAGKTPRRAILRAIELMARAQHPPFGVVLNFMRGNSGYGYYYHYAQKYGYKGKRRPKQVVNMPELTQS